jgi:hypothetical protein
MGGMEKTTVYLTAEQKAALARAAAVEGRSEARLIRAGIDVVTARHRAAESSSATVYGVQAAEAALGGGPAAAGRPRWLPRDAFVREVVRHPADAGLRAELRELAPDATDETRLG